MKQKEKAKILRYRRADFIQASDGQSLETLIRKAHRLCATTDTRKVSYEDGRTLEIREQIQKQGGGTLLHLAAYTKREPASIVPTVKNKESAPVSEIPPPADAEYMDGDLMAYVNGNHVVICTNGITDHSLVNYCVQMFQKCEFDVKYSIFHLERVADADKIQMIEDQGVSEINLRTTAYDASIIRAKRKTIRSRIGGRLWEEILAMSQDDSDLDEIHKNDALSAKVVIKFNRLRKGGEISAETIKNLAKEVVSEDDDGFRIKTARGNFLGASDIALQKKVNIRTQGKSVVRTAAFEELQAYYAELHAAGSVHT